MRWWNYRFYTRSFQRAVGRCETAGQQERVSFRSRVGELLLIVIARAWHACQPAVISTDRHCNRLRNVPLSWQRACQSIRVTVLYGKKGGTAKWIRPWGWKCLGDYLLHASIAFPSRGRWAICRLRQIGRMRWKPIRYINKRDKMETLPPHPSP